MEPWLQKIYDGAFENELQKLAKLTKGDIFAAQMGAASGLIPGGLLYAKAGSKLVDIIHSEGKLGKILGKSKLMRKLPFLIPIGLAGGGAIAGLGIFRGIKKITKKKDDGD